MVNLNQAVAKLKNVLCEGHDTLRCREALEILYRWQWDDDIDAASRDEAKRLVGEYRGRF